MGVNRTQHRHITDTRYLLNRHLISGIFQLTLHWADDIVVAPSLVLEQCFPTDPLNIVAADWYTFDMNVLAPVIPYEISYPNIKLIPSHLMDSVLLTSPAVIHPLVHGNINTTLGTPHLYGVMMMELSLGMPDSRRAFFLQLLSEPDTRQSAAAPVRCPDIHGLHDPK